MSDKIEHILVLGAGSAGFLAALAFKRLCANIRVTIIRSAKVPIIGVGESTTAAVPPFLHETIGLDRGEFYRAVRPTWKLGNRFLWGSPELSHFNYTFDTDLSVCRDNLPRADCYFCLTDLQDATLSSALMDRGLAPCTLNQGRYTVNEVFGYHLNNRLFIEHLEQMAGQFGIEILTGDVVHAQRTATGDVGGLKLEDGRLLEADLYVDCSGFQSVLLEKTMGEKYVSYSDTLFCDRAVIGSFDRDGPILPYTTSETMEHGWCWQIEFDDYVTRGYVHSSQFCSADEAMQELKDKNPQLGDDLRTISFPSGRYENFWVGNVVAIGNASGFVEPLEATALHLVGELVRSVIQTFHEGGGRVLPQIRKLQNDRYRQLWDDVRDFLAIHYKFNHWSNSPFWRHCRAAVMLHGAEPLIDFYRQAGPSELMSKFIYEESIFRRQGWLQILIGQRVATDFDPEFTQEDWRNWNARRDRVRQQAMSALPVREALQKLYGADSVWPHQGL
ncbi:MAG: tryptophan halogenase family protein [Pirellulales bacterium]